jgi:hypothetical protein
MKRMKLIPGLSMEWALLCWLNSFEVKVKPSKRKQSKKDKKGRTK